MGKREKPALESAGLSCPSAPATPGAVMIGIVGSDGMVHPLARPLPVDQDFVENAARHGSPEARFRFSNECVEGRCRQWTGHSCGIVAKVLDHMERQKEALPTDIPRCSIRATCRWHAERGFDACRACLYVVTDQSRPSPAASSSSR